MAKNEYAVSLLNVHGVVFDKGDFTNIKECRKWAKGRGATLVCGEWYPYRVTIFKNGKEYMEYMTR